VLVSESIREWFRRNVLRPLLRVLRGGVTPRRLAWSLALGMVVGVNPSVGLTTLLVVLVAWIFGLSKLASLIGTHVVAPLHLLLFIPFIELGVHLFHTRKLPMDRKQLERLSHHPLRLFTTSGNGSGTRSLFGEWWRESRCLCWLSTCAGHWLCCCEGIAPWCVQGQRFTKISPSGKITYAKRSITFIE
jgi:hypothetical protein